MLLAPPPPAWAGAGDDEPAHIGKWAWGFRAGAEIYVGAAADLQVQLADGTQDTLFPGPNLTAFLERTWTDHLRLGFEAGAMVAAAGDGADLERKITTVVWGPYLRALAFPGGVTPYALLATGVYHTSTSGDLEVFEQNVGFSYAAGGGIEFPIVPRWYNLFIEGRFRQFLQGGTDPKIAEILLVTHIWLD